MNSAASLVSSMYASSNEARCAPTSAKGTAGRGEQRDDPLRGQTGDREGVGAGDRDRAALPGEQLHRLRAGARAQGHAVAGRGGEQGGDGGVRDEAAAADDQQVVSGVLQLAHEVAGDQDGAALPGQSAQQAADPLDALGIKAVDRFVEQEHRRVSEQRGRYAQALAHTE